MSSITIKIRTDNAAFDDDCGNVETARILRNIANRLEEGVSYTRNIMDSNGNCVGSVVVKN